ncbi:MAG: ubiquinol-cytochrome C chaperone family protein [Pseudomonadota bacterium]
MGIFGIIFRRDAATNAARALYATAVARARETVFYTDFGTPDTVDGRFELVAIHVFLLIRRLDRGDVDDVRLAQQLFDHMFDDMEINLREMGVGDPGIGKKIKRMAQGFHGRANAYEAGLTGEAGQLEEALRRNLYGTTEPMSSQIQAVAAYVRREAAALDRMDPAALLRGRHAFGTLAHMPGPPDRT